MAKSLTLLITICIAIVVGAYFSPLLGVLSGIIFSVLLLALQNRKALANDNLFELSTDAADATAAIITQSIAINRECVSDLNHVLTTQNEAIALLSNHFVQLQSVIDTQSKLLSAIIAPSSQASAEERENIVQKALQHMQSLHSHPLIQITDNQIKVNIADAVRSLQFGDINGQSLSFTIETLSTYNNLLSGLLEQHKTLNISDVQPQLTALQALRENKKNPVTSQTTAAGEVELF
ncbi:hypothetical protein QTP81_16415 [Alteromonas sp. ASW11-36]|uniref:Uncharacterized protein n=1 Tax=Alteromonas arenosi TaxID=3055817 RepID=A0ABT7T161_9ALTE|nr:hypothetical protein [Alteromonas sp. ASW11-36]MDM7862191.1 hypothetical protein [Alteromonas sp. ASW11-36]